MSVYYIKSYKFSDYLANTILNGPDIDTIVPNPDISGTYINNII